MRRRGSQRLSKPGLLQLSDQQADAAGLFARRVAEFMSSQVGDLSPSLASNALFVLAVEQMVVHADASEEQLTSLVSYYHRRISRFRVSELLAMDTPTRSIH